MQIFYIPMFGFLYVIVLKITGCTAFLLGSFLISILISSFLDAFLEHIKAQEYLLGVLDQGRSKLEGFSTIFVLQTI